MMHHAFWSSQYSCVTQHPDPELRDNIAKIQAFWQHQSFISEEGLHRPPVPGLKKVNDTLSNPGFMI